MSMAFRGKGVAGYGRAHRARTALAFAAALLALAPIAASAQMFSDRPPPVPPVRVNHDAIDRIRTAPVGGMHDPRCPLHRRYPLQNPEVRQNRKYLCAMGNTSAGAQVNSSPSAVTS